MLKCLSKAQTIARKCNDEFDHKIILKTKNETIKLVSYMTAPYLMYMDPALTV